MHHTESFDCSWKCRFTLNYMSLVSLLTRFSLFRAPWMMSYWKKWAETRQTHYSAFCVAPGNWLMLLFTMYLHFFKIGCKINLFSWDSFNFERFFISINDFSCFYMSLWLVLQESNPCFNRNLIFFLFDFCLYTSLWYKRGKSNLFSIIVMQINAPSTPQIPSEGWFCSHQWHP